MVTTISCFPNHHFNIQFVMWLIRSILFWKFETWRVAALVIAVIYTGILYGIYVPDWQFEDPMSLSLEGSKNISMVTKYSVLYKHSLTPQYVFYTWMQSISINCYVMSLDLISKYFWNEKLSTFTGKMQC